MVHRLQDYEHWYILCAGRVVYVGDFTHEEVALLIESLKDEFPGPFEGVAESKLSANPKELVRLNRDWDDISPFLGEFDFGVWDFEFPEEWKQLIYVNDSAERLAGTIRGLRKQQNDECEPTKTTFEVHDKNTRQSVFFNTEGAQSWGPVRSYDDELDPNWTEESRLFRHGSEAWTLIVASYLCEPSAPAPMPEAERLDSTAAVRWLMRNGFDVPADVAHLAEDLAFRPGPPSPKNAPADVSDAEHWGPAHKSDWLGNGDPSWTDEMHLFRHYGQYWVLVTERTYDVASVPPTKESQPLNDREAVNWLLTHGYTPPHDVAHLIPKPGCQAVPADTQSDSEHSQEMSPHPIPRRLCVDVDANKVVLDGKEYSLSTEQIRYVDALVTADGLWRSASEMNITKVDRLRKSLPPKIQDLIETTAGKGSRIPRERLRDSQDS